MRLINVNTLQFEEFLDERQLPPYAILSHTLDGKELQFHHFLDQERCRKDDKLDFTKIDFTCGQAKKDSLDYAWIDTCCIDKTSSAELSEAINSMFRWYQKSAKCYVFLSDVEQADLADAPGEYFAGSIDPATTMGDRHTEMATSTVEGLDDPEPFESAVDPQTVSSDGAHSAGLSVDDRRSQVLVHGRAVSTSIHWKARHASRDNRAPSVASLRRQSSAFRDAVTRTFDESRWFYEDGHCRSF